MIPENIPKIFLIIIFIMISNFLVAQQTITVNPLPIIGLQNELFIPPGQDSVQPFFVTDDPGPGQTYSYGWVGPNGFVSSVMTPWLSELGNYTLTATNSNGCSSTYNLLLRESQLGDTLFYYISPRCVDEEPIWLQDYVSHPMEGYFSGTYVVNDYLYFAQAGQHQVVWHIDDREIIYNYRVLASPMVDIPDDTIFRCEGQNAILYAQGNSDSWSWMVNGSVFSTEEVVQVFVNEPLYYFLNGSMVYETEQKTCSAKDSVFVSPISARFTYEQLTIDTTYGTLYGSWVRFYPDYEKGISYNWDMGYNGVTSSLVNPHYNYAGYYGTVEVTLQIESVCGDYTHSEFVFINYETGVSELIKQDDFNLYPNPVDNILNLDFGDKKVFRVEVWDMVGKQVFVDQSIGDIHTQVDVSSYKPGFYILRLFGKQGGIVSLKFIKK